MEHNMDELFSGLNEQQHQAVSAGPGPVLVLAGPGSGKTGVLTRRIAYLIRGVGVRPWEIMAVTFTNKAAAEMRHRVDGLLGERIRGLQLGTFHSICSRILRIEHDQTPYREDFVIYDTDDQLSAVGQALSELNIDSKKANPRRVLSLISAAKNELIGPRDFVAQDYFSEIVARIYPRYQAILLDSNALDFDDLLMQMVLLMRENEGLRQRYQQKITHVLVDEFQDTNLAQYQLVQWFSKPQDNIFVVGDEDQSIYAFRGADYRNVLHFRDDYPDAKVVLLEENYRSTQIVLDVARSIIDKNSNRTPKALHTRQEGGERVTIHEAYDDEYEARYVLEQVEALHHQQGYAYNDIAVMYRTNTQSRAMERACVEWGVPYTLVGGVGFYKRREVRDLLAYLRVVNNPDDRVSFARICNVPKRGIGQKSLETFQQWAADQSMSYRDALIHLASGQPNPLGRRVSSLFTEFAELIASWQPIARSGELVQLFDRIMQDTHYRRYVEEYSDSELIAGERFDNLNELRGLLAQATEDKQSLGEFLADQMLMTDVDEVRDDSDKITLLTLHAAKGLEYAVVFITGLEEGLLPHQRAFEEEDGIAEERRLFYVGVTRAKERLYLTYAFRRTTWGGSETREKSDFLLDIPDHLLQGMPVNLRGSSSQAHYKRMTSWDSRESRESSPPDRGLNRLRHDLKQMNSASDADSRPTTGNRNKPALPEDPALRGKIIPFPGSSADREPRYRTGQRVRHGVFGAGIVIESELSGRDDEEVTVAFSDKRYGIKRLLGSMANLEILT